MGEFVFFKLNIPDNGHSEKNKQHLMQIFELIKNNELQFLKSAIESSPVPFLVNQLTDLMIANLNVFI